jgi:hypothetical protein
MALRFGKLYGGPTEMRLRMVDVADCGDLDVRTSRYLAQIVGAFIAGADRRHAQLPVEIQRVSAAPSESERSTCRRRPQESSTSKMTSHIRHHITR